MEDKVSWFIKLWDERNPTSFGIGECGPLPGLSLDATNDFDGALDRIVADINSFKSAKAPEHSNPSIIANHFKKIFYQENQFQ